MRALSHATFLTPDIGDWKTGGRYWLNRNRIYLDAWRNSPKALLGMIWADGPDSGYFDHSPGTPGFQVSAWEHQYATVEIAKAAGAKLLSDAVQRTAFDITADWLLSSAPRWVNEQTNGGWRYIPYKVTLGRDVATVDSLPTWGQQMGWFYADAPSGATGPWQDVTGQTYAGATVSGPGGGYYPSYFWSALVAAVDRGVPGAAQAWSTVQASITNLTAWRAGFATDPRWGSTPRSN